MISPAFESFAHSLRIMVEVNERSHKLLLLDPHEAAGNIEQAVTQVLNAFHSFYDSSKDEAAFDWYGTVETATILAVRNARHHNIANRIRGLYAYHLQLPNPQNPSSYVYVDYPEAEDAGYTFDIPISWFDMNQMLHLPSEEVRLKNKIQQSILDYLDEQKMNNYAAGYNVPNEHIFFNSVPLIVNALIKLMPILRGYIKPESVEAETFADLYKYVLPSKTHRHVVNTFTLALPA